MALKRIVISGCSGGGKSTLIDALSSRGFRTVAEAGRIIVHNELIADGRALPWIDPKLFAEELAALAAEQFASAAELDEPVFFDRSVVEPLVFSKIHGLELSEKVGRQAKDCRYDNPIFVVPPWEEIFVQDAERRHSFRDAVNEYEALYTAFLEFNYEVRVIPKMAIDARVDYIVEGLGL